MHFCKKWYVQNKIDFFLTNDHSMENEAYLGWFKAVHMVFTWYPSRYKRKFWMELLNYFLKRYFPWLIFGVYILYLLTLEISIKKVSTETLHCMPAVELMQFHIKDVDFRFNKCNDFNAWGYLGEITLTACNQIQKLKKWCSAVAAWFCFWKKKKLDHFGISLFKSTRERNFARNASVHCTVTGTVRYRQPLNSMEGSGGWLTV